MQMKCLSILSLLALAGCSHTPPYVVPAGAPQAQIRSELQSGENYRNGVTLREANTTACKYGRTVSIKTGAPLFSVYKNASTPDGFIAIEAGRPLHLVLSGSASANRSCSIGFVSEFKPGGHYVLKGGLIDDGTWRSGCHVVIFDQDSGLPVAKGAPHPWRATVLWTMCLC